MSFLHAGLLGLAGLFVVPLIIHILNRRRFKRVPWAAMEFLLKAYKQNRRRLRVESLLLLLLRCAIPVLLALAIARPRLLQGATLDPLQQQGPHHVFVLDRSYSMAYRSASSDRPFDRMKQALSPLLEQISNRGNEKISLVYAGETASTPVTGDLDVSKAQRALARLEEPSDGKARLADALQEAKRLVAAETDPARVYVFSDFHRVALESTNDAASIDDDPDAEATNRSGTDMSAAPANSFQRLRDLCQDLVDGDTKVLFFPLTPRGVTSNTQVVSLGIEPENAVARVPARIRAEIVHRGPQPRDVLARLRVDGDNEQIRRIRLETGESGEVTFVVRFLEPGMHFVELEIGEDGLAIDDRRVFVADVRDRIRVLLVEGRETAEEEEILQESFLTRSILDPTRGEGGDELTLFETKVIDEDRFQSDASFMRDQHVIALFDVSAPRADVAKRLESFVARGGGLLIVPGKRTIADLWNLRLFGANGQEGPLPMRLLALGGSAPSPGQLDGGRYSTARVVDLESPVFADFRNEELRTILEHTPIYRYWQTARDRIPEETTVLAEFVGGDAIDRPALLATRNWGRGTCMLLTSGLSRRPDRWNRLDDLDIIRFPLVHSVFHWLAREPKDSLNRIVGHPLSTWVPTKPTSLYVTLPGDRGRVPLTLPTAPIGNVEANGWMTPTFEGATHAGLYRLGVEFEDKTKPAREVLFAVNPDPSEGLLDYLGSEALAREFPGVDVRPNLELDLGNATQASTSELGRFFMVLALLFVLGESVLAGFLGRRRR